MNTAEQAGFATVFDWKPPRSRRAVLVGCIVGSFLLHALCFYLFQIIYPPTVALLPPPARVEMITPDSEDGRGLLRWIEAEDPALSSTTQRPPNSPTLEPPRAEYVPSFANHVPALQELPPYEPDLRIPSARPPAPVQLMRASAAPQKIAVPTAIRFADTTELGVPTVPALHFTASRNEPPEATQFRIAIGEHGAVRFCFLTASSQDAALDEQARQFVMQCRFPQVEKRASKIENSLTWTAATIEWGNDLATPERRDPGAP